MESIDEYASSFLDHISTGLDLDWHFDLILPKLQSHPQQSQLNSDYHHFNVL